MIQDNPGAPSAPPSPGATASPTSDRRGQRRRRVLKEGKLIFGTNRSVADCVIDNVSEGGAHVRITGTHSVPPDFYLAEANRGIIHKAEVVWRTSTGMGLRILGQLEDAAARETLFRKFRRG